MPRWQFTSIRARLTFWLLTIAIAPLLITFTLIYNQRVTALKKEIFDKLLAVRDLKVAQVNDWLDERTGDVKTIAENPEIRMLAETFADMPNNPGKPDMDKDIKHILQQYLANYDNYYNISMLNASTGIVVLSTDSLQERQDLSEDEALTGPLRTRGIYLKDIYYSKTLNRITMAFSIPIFSPSQKERIAGVLVARMNLEQSLFELLLQRTGMGQTGETLLVNQDVVALNELRWYANAPLKLKIAAQPAVLAARGETGIVETTDYRGERVLAAYTHIARTNWGFVAKQDLQEVYAPVRALLNTLMLLFGLTVLGVIGMAYALSRNLAKPVIAMSDVAQQIQAGNYAMRTTIAGRDESALLARTLNNMADAITSQLEIQRKSRILIETLVTAKDLADFRTQITKALVEITGSQIGSYFLRDETGDTFRHAFSIGASVENLKTFDAETLEGEFGKSLATKTIVHLKNIPADTVFSFKTIVGMALPREIITIPILVENEVQAVLSIASLQGYTPEDVAVIEQNLVSINTAVANFRATERIKHLVEDLQSQQTELEKQARELEMQAEELRQQSEELQHQNTELDMQRRQVEEANRLKSEFLSNMSHELRTPLNSVIALARVLTMQAQAKLSEEEGNYLEIIERNGKHLLHLINDILDLSKIEAGKVEVLPKAFAIQNVVETVRESLEPLAAAKNIQILVEIADDFPSVSSDESKVRQILQNIMGNAVKFTEKGVVEISAVYNSDNMYLSVKDTGIGIPQKDLSHIFEEFRQVDGSTSRKYEGTGLGLSIALKYARLLGGEILVESVLGAGSSFTLVLPLKYQEIRDMQYRRGQFPSREGLGVGSGASRSSETQLTHPLPLPGGESSSVTENLGEGEQDKQKSVLVIDDEPYVVSMIAEYLTSIGYNVMTATSGKKALELAQRFHPFAITLDIIMSDMDGWEILQTLKQNPQTADISVIMISVSDDRDTAFALGAVGYITKPVHKEALIAEIRKATVIVPATVMVVDDNDIDRQQEARILAEEKMRVTMAESGLQCLEFLQESVPDVIVLDLMMPGMDGFAVLDMIRSERKTKDVPVIVVTAKDLTLEERRKLQGDASAILTKSATTPQELLGQIKEVLARIVGEPRYASVKPSLPQTRLLLVEDSEPAIVQIKQVLEKSGYRVDVARNGKEAIAYVRVQIPDGIILDLMMPEMDGFEVLERIRGRETTANIPVLILTAKDLTAEELNRLSANHIQQLIQKGDVDKNQLLFKIKLMLGSAPKTPSPIPLTGMGFSESPLNPPVNGGKYEKVTEASFPSLAGGTQTSFPSLAGGTQRGQKTPYLSAQDGQGEGEKPVILLVEDNPDNLITMKAICQPHYNLLEAVDGQEGLQTAIKHVPDIILLDMSLPKMDGFEVVARLKQHEKTRLIPVIALTAHAMKGDREKMLNAGCDDYISKPVKPETLLKCVQKWLKK